MDLQRTFENIKKEKELYWLAWYLGLTGFGGLAVIEQIKIHYVQKKNIISEKKFLHALSLAQIVPGSTIINLIAYFSYLKAGLIGAIIGTTIYILPTFIITTFFAHIYFTYSNIEAVKIVISALNIFVISLLIRVLVNLSMSFFISERKIDYRGIGITFCIFILSFLFHLSTIQLIIISGLIGGIVYTYTSYFKNTPRAPIEKYEQFIKRKKAWGILIGSIIIFAISLLYISHPLWVLFSSFMKIGTLSFGGGVAAIPLIENIFVNNLSLFTLRQFWDGISISQITPGPIMIVSAFFGYKIYGILGAAIATIAMCIPSILLIILFGKIHERIKHQRFIRGLLRGFLSGFISILLIMIITQAHFLLHDWKSILLVVITLIVLLKVKKGFSISLLLCLFYAILYGFNIM